MGVTGELGVQGYYDKGKCMVDFYTKCKGGWTKMRGDEGFIKVFSEC